ncbi:glycosyltransferase family 4 protein, partial [Rhodobacteraceae bacterium 2376]
LRFTRWTGQGIFIIPNTSSFMFRRAPMREHLGYWDTVRFSADNELVRRMRLVFGRKSVQFLKTGPLSFQRDSDTSIVADDVLGINGFLFGARKEYFDAQRVHHASGAALKYDNRQRHFQVPTVMRPDRAQLTAQARHIPVIVGTEWRMPGGSIESSLEDLRALHRRGQRAAVFQLSRYDLNTGDGVRLHMLEEARAEMERLGTQVLSYGDHVSCDLLILRYPPSLWHDQRYLPQIDAKHVKVIVNQPPMSDYGPEGVPRYDIAACAANIRRWFGREATWHPIGPLVRDALVTHHGAELGAIDLSAQDWHNIIDISGWDRGIRRRGPGDRLRIGRHARDHAHKWPDTAADILAAYPEAEDTEVHVLGGAATAERILGRIPPNWVVHPFGSLHPRDFLAGIDVWVYFSHPDWVESFGRTIIEAMAAGVPVILPEAYRPLFRDAALYATPQTALAMAQALHADPAAYNRQVAVAKDYVRAQFSYEMHYERLKELLSA